MTLYAKRSASWNPFLAEVRFDRRVRRSTPNELRQPVYPLKLVDWRSLKSRHMLPQNAVAFTNSSSVVGQPDIGAWRQTRLPRLLGYAAETARVAVGWLRSASARAAALRHPRSHCKPCVTILIPSPAMPSGVT